MAFHSKTAHLTHGTKELVEYQKVKKFLQKNKN
jgi:hypothetical protein